MQNLLIMSLTIIHKCTYSVVNLNQYWMSGNESSFFDSSNANNNWWMELKSQFNCHSQHAMVLKLFLYFIFWLQINDYIIIVARKEGAGR